MRAVTMEQGVLTHVELPDPKPAKGEVLVRTLACGICGSDLHAARYVDDFVKTSREVGGAFKLTTFNPVVLGHEFCAEIVDYGPNTERSLPVGTMVCSIPMLRRTPPEPIGFSEAAPGGFGEYMLLSQSLMTPVPGGLNAEMAALTEPMAVGYHAVNKANLRGSEATLVIGCGPVGLAVIIALKQRGVAPIVATDYSSTRRALAIKVGADVVFDPADKSAYTYAPLTTEDVIYFECVGVPGMLDELFVAAPKHARIVVVGVCISMDHSRPLIAVNKELSLQYVLGYTEEEFVQSLHHIGSGEFDVSQLITDETGLDGVANAFEVLANPEQQGKILVKPGL
jgi:threonine dehydrogenase-like Zn-dependent dehydrogenase|tara:strand:- start:279 stop:1298 length:1020 start_codon:yes stop_codon:yes gene_type:complete